jgi:hypothetical protein
MSNAAKNVAFAEGLRTKQEKMNPDQVNMAAATGRTPEELARAETREPGIMDEQFPTNDLVQKDKRDRAIEAKLALADEQGQTPFGMSWYTKEDGEYVLRKQAAVERANMEAWFAKNFDFMSPAQKQYAKKIFPEFYHARRRLLKQQCDNLFDVARIKLDGIEDLDDAKKQYLLETGRLDLGPLQNVMHPEGVNMRTDASGVNQQRFQRGIANPFLVFGRMAEPMNYDTRREQSTNFAARKRDENWDTNAALGIRDTGFPPFSGNESNQSTAAWFQKLQSGLNAL